MNIFLSFITEKEYPEASILNIFAIKNIGAFVANWAQVLLGKKTWVGYTKEASQLPYLKNGVISSNESFGEMNLDELTLAKLNWLYAKHYSVGSDLKLLLKKAAMMIMVK